MSVLRDATTHRDLGNAYGLASVLHHRSADAVDLHSASDRYTDWIPASTAAPGGETCANSPTLPTPDATGSATRPLRKRRAAGGVPLPVVYHAVAKALSLFGSTELT